MTEYTEAVLQQKIEQYSSTTVGPVIYEYTRWILNECRDRNITVLYFLARDGYLLYEAAKRICKSNSLNIDCKYLYCSRQSLRTPTYHIIGDEAYDLLLLGGYYVTPKTILERAQLTEAEAERLYKELDISDRNRPFSDAELEIFRQKIKNNAFYKDAVEKKSKATYHNTIEYFKQEGLFETDKIAIVDSGWTGSMQRSIRQLLESAGHKAHIIGFYFGMYVKPKEARDGEYLTYYFSASNGAKRKAMFNNNLFECMLSANHAMTVGYEKKDGRISPVFASAQTLKDEQLHLIEHQIAGALKYVDSALSKEKEPFIYRKSIRKCYKLLKKAMVYPTKDFATVYGMFTFCDDVTEGYSMSLASPERRKALENYMLIPRVFRKLLKIKKSDAGELFWPYGVIAFCPAVLRPYYRINVQAWELLKAILL